MGDVRNLSNNTVLADMGKTVVIDGYIYRKVQIHTASFVITPNLPTGYICLNSDEAPLFDGDNQGVSKLNYTNEHFKLVILFSITVFHFHFE
jgi:hypothetical protein